MIMKNKISIITLENLLKFNDTYKLEQIIFFF